jgi:two-component system, OmpR family, sensor kinase
MTSSIRTILLSWYTLILFATVAIFGVVVHCALRHNVYGSIDDRIRDEAVAIAITWEDDSKESAKAIVFDVAELFPAFRAEGPEDPYFVGWSADGTLRVASREGLSVPFPGGVTYRDRGDWREIAVQGTDGRLVLVGEHTGAARAQLRSFARLLIGSGLGVLVLALVGGWFLCGRVLAPIHRMSRTAAEISASNFSRRIDVKATESELGRLARTLNSAFDRLQGAVEQQTRFTADASHELRTPVSVVLTTAEHALARERSAADYRRALEAVLRAAKRMKSLVEGLLVLVRADSGRAAFARDVVEVADVVEETLDFLSPLARQNGVTLSSDAARTQVVGDHERLREVFTNLVANGIRYNRPGGRVDVVVRETAEHVEVSVSDTGIGIPADHLPHLFERFHRVDPARSRAAGGCGLGLAISKWIVEGHGGSIAVESREGEGSTFTVRLPRPDRPAVERAQEDAAAASGSSRSVHVLRE